MVEGAFKWFLYSTLGGSITILAVLAAIALFRDRFSARVRHVLWLVVLIRLLLPAFPSSPFSLMQLINMDLGQVLSFSFSGSEEAIPVSPVMQQSAASLEERSEQAEEGATSLAQPGGKLTLEAEKKTNVVLSLFAWLWLAGIMTFLAVIISHVLRLKQMFKGMRPVEAAYLIDIMEECRSKLGIRGGIRLYTGGAAKSGPFIYGVFRPKVYIPEALCQSLSATQLRYVLMHELAHRKRYDVLWNWVGGMAIAIHWMNPLVWLAIQKMKADRELACDACVLNALEPREVLLYGQTILEVLKTFASRQEQRQAIGLYGAGARKQLERRLIMIKGYKKGSYKLTAVSILCVIAVCAGTLTNAAAPDNSRSDGTLLKSKLAENVVLFEQSSGSRTYNNLEKAVAMADFSFKVPEVLPDAFSFESASLSTVRNRDGEEGLNRVRIAFRSIGGEKNNWSFTAELGGPGIEQAYSAMEENEKFKAEETNAIRKTAPTAEAALKISKQTANINGIDMLRAEISRGKSNYIQYFWQDEGVQYGMGPFRKEDDKIVPALVSSLKKPKLPLSKPMVNESLLNAAIYDTDDVWRGVDALGFTPKLPLHVIDRYMATDAAYTLMVNFGYANDKTERDKRVLSIGYALPEAGASNGEADEVSGGIQKFILKQTKSNTIIQDMKNNGAASFERIDGERFTAPVSVVRLGGQEVFRTEPYKIDGALSRPDETDFVSYFWQEGEALFQVRFAGDGGSVMEEIVAALIRQRPIE
jgi:bla regulator protein BlaR1